LKFTQIKFIQAETQCSCPLCVSVFRDSIINSSYIYSYKKYICMASVLQLFTCAKFSAFPETTSIPNYVGNIAISGQCCPATWHPWFHCWQGHGIFPFSAVSRPLLRSN